MVQLLRYLLGYLSGPLVIIFYEDFPRSQILLIKDLYHQKCCRMLASRVLCHTSVCVCVCVCARVCACVRACMCVCVCVPIITNEKLVVTWLIIIF